VAQIYREAGANTLKMQAMDLEGSASDVNIDFVTIGSGGGGGATAGLDYDIVAFAPGIYVELVTGITSWDGPWRASAVVRMVQVALA
jgi:hypothetical protein